MSFARYLYGGPLPKVYKQLPLWHSLRYIRKNTATMRNNAINKQTLSLPICLTTFVLAALCMVNFGFAQAKELRVGSTFTTQDSGLLEVLIPAFEKATGIKTRAIVAGTGQILKYGERGDVDVLLTHAPEDEARFVAAGYGIERREVMYNDFIIVGPKTDPLKLRSTTDPVAALIKIRQAAVPFASRGDDSGTHKMELRLWARAAQVPIGKWYLSTGQGMGQTLLIANERQAYALSERGSFLALKKRLDLDVLIEPEPPLANIYGVIPVSISRHPYINAQAAKQFADWVTSSAGQLVISSFRIDGKQVFFIPTAPKKAG